MKRKCESENERTREMETNRLLSRHFGGDNAHLTGGNFFLSFATVRVRVRVRVSVRERGKLKESKVFMLTCA